MFFTGFPQFGTVSNPTTAQSSLISQIQARYKAFLNTGSPNVPNLSRWSPAGSSDVNPIQLGGTSQVSVGACTPSFWGQAVQYDYQFYAGS